MIAYVKELCDGASENTVIKNSRWRNSFGRRSCIVCRSLQIVCGIL